jgi:hypothetical protein
MAYREILVAFAAGEFSTVNLHPVHRVREP